MAKPKIEHFIVLMFENRSFDHLFGFLDHPNLKNGLKGTEYNPKSSTDNTKITVTKNGIPNLPNDPGHHHKDVMEQLFHNVKDPYTNLKKSNNSGFVTNYKKVIDPKGKNPNSKEAIIMDCFKTPQKVDDHLNVIGTLAKEFALCDNWFSSVPGATWPNRLFAHAATSDGKADNKLKLYGNRTIYELFADNKLTWDIYHDGPAQSMAYYKLWFKRRGGFNNMDQFYKDVSQDKLANYIFIEPRHFRLTSSYTNSMHPGNNPNNTADFEAAEKLLYDIYLTLINNKKVWEKTTLVVTFDEHGGFYDHIKPPVGKKYIPDGKKAGKFEFNMLGVRVPAIIISPWIEKGTVDSTLYDHSSLIKTARRLFGIDEHLTNRDKNAHSFAHLITENKRSLKQLPMPIFSPLGSRLRDSRRGFAPKSESMDTINDFQAELVEMARQIENVKGNTVEEVEAKIKKLEVESDLRVRNLSLRRSENKEGKVNRSMISFTQRFSEKYGIKER